MKDKFPFAVGVELTGIRKEYSPTSDISSVADNNSLTDAASRLVSAAMAKRYPDHYRISNYRDVHCVEFPSPIFKTLGEMKQFYDFTMAQFAKYYIAPHHPEIVCGGNHLHFELDDLEWIKKVLRDSVSRPWLPWVFTQPDDTTSCSNYDDAHLGKKIRRVSRFIKDSVNPEPPYTYCSPTSFGFHYMLTNDNPYSSFKQWGGATASKDFAFSFDHLPSSKAFRSKKFKDEMAFVLEIRCVEAPLNWSEMMDQLDFFIRYVNWVKARPMPKGRTRLWKKKELQSIRRCDCVKEFYALLHQLGLDSKRYEKYVRRNLYTRWNLKRKRL